MEPSLPVAAGNDRGVRALCVGELEQTCCLVDRGGGCALRKEIIEQAGGVRSANTLDPHIRGTVVGFERVGENRPWLFALRMLASSTEMVCLRNP